MPADAASATNIGLAKSADGSASVLGRLRDYRIVDLEISHDRPPAGQYVKEVAWPPSTLVVAIRRGADAFTPNGMTLLQRGDRLTVLAPVRFAESLSEIVTTTRDKQIRSTGFLPPVAVPSPDSAKAGTQDMASGP
jgi:Trk K+ transport system NAD-binding subunit